MADPGSHCPANKAADIVGDKWVLLILRAMLLGATRYSDFQAAIPRISPSVLSGRLKQLVEDGLIVRKGSGQGSARYRLAPSGRELEPMIFFMAAWGLKWAQRNIRDEQVDTGGLMWDFHKTLDITELPDGETVFGVILTDLAQHDKWWIIASGSNLDLCNENPGKEVDLYISCDVPTLIAMWMGELPVTEAVREEAVSMTGEPHLMRSASRWFPRSPVARAKEAAGDGPMVFPMPEMPAA